MRQLLLKTLLVYLACTVLVTSKIDPFAKFIDRDNPNRNQSSGSTSRGRPNSGSTSSGRGRGKANAGKINFMVVNYDRPEADGGKIISNSESSSSMW